MSPRRPVVLDGANYTTPAVRGHSAVMALQIRHEVRRRGLTQKEFAELVGAREERISLVLRCIRRADPATLDRWARLLGMQWRVELVPAEEERRMYRYRCDTCADVINAPVRLDSIPVLVAHPDGGFQHYVGDTTELCGPMREVSVHEEKESRDAELVTPEVAE